MIRSTAAFLIRMCRFYGVMAASIYDEAQLVAQSRRHNR